MLSGSITAFVSASARSRKCSPRGVTVNSETVRQWCFKVEQTDQNFGRVVQEFRDVIALIKILTESKHLPNRRALRKGSGVLGTTTYAVF